jgi:ABC-type polysaccharide/polyol phosphate transport system ATPase subunit
MLKIENVSLELPVVAPDLKYFKKALLKSILDRKFSIANNTVLVSALKNVSLNFNEGQTIGIIGPNGSGKTTLLRLISGIAKPTTGEVTVEGIVAPILSTGIGVQEHATGYENIELILLQLGLSKSKISEISPEIVEFCELGDFMFLPLNTYSTGMKTRLLFSILTSFSPDIVAMDEIISTGDLNFQNKASKRLREYFQKIKLAIVASHDIGWVEENCDAVVLMNNGEVVNFGSPALVCKQFREMCF